MTDVTYSNITDPGVFKAIVEQICKETPQIREIIGGHWVKWVDYQGREVASQTCSPYPGPDRGTTCRIRSDLVSYREVIVPTYRDLNATEAHILNNRLFDGRDNDVGLLMEVEQLYRDLKNNKPKHRLYKGSYQFRYTKCVRIIEGRIYG